VTAPPQQNEKKGSHRWECKIRKQKAKKSIIIIMQSTSYVTLAQCNLIYQHVQKKKERFMGGAVNELMFEKSWC
jgi:hypothetical protein